MTDRRLVTAEWLAENQRKRDAYEARRRAWTAPWHRPPEDAEPESPQPDQAGRPVRPLRGRGIIHDKRQDRFEF